MPVTFTSRALKDNELNYSTIKKEVLALFAYTGDLLHYASHSAPQSLDKTLKNTWLVNYTGLQGSVGDWAALLSLWRS